MLLCKTLFLLILLASGRNCEEPHCSKYDFEEKVLEKMVRIEFQMERMKAEVEQCVEKVENIKTEVSDQMERNRQELVRDLDDQKVEVTNITAAVHVKLQEVQTLNDNIDTPTVAFKARLNANTVVTHGQAIVFPAVIFNEGEAYNIETGKFTASVSGAYMFSVSFCVKNQKSLVVGIMIGGDKYTTSHFYGDSGIGCLSADTVAILTAGQKVWVEGLSGSSSGSILESDMYRWNTFSGVLIN